MASTRDWPDDFKAWVAGEGLDPGDLCYLDATLRLAQAIRNLRQRVAQLEQDRDAARAAIQDLRQRVAALERA